MRNFVHVHFTAQEMSEKKEHVSITITGHVDAGKSTATGRLLFELGGIKPREMERLQKIAEEAGKSSFAFAFYMDTQKEERERGVTIACNTKEFFTDSKHYTIIDSPGHRDYIKNMITGSSQADVALLMVPADGNFITSIAKGNHKEGVVQGQTRQHALLLNLLGVKQLIVGINKMDSDVAKYSKERFDEIKAEMMNMLAKTGWKKDFIKKSVPFLPISGWKGDNLVKKSESMKWWKGQDVQVGDKTVHVDTLLDALDKMVVIPKRNREGKLRVPISGVYNIKGVGDVLTGRVEQGVVKPDMAVRFVPSHTAANPCAGKVFTVEMHHKAVPEAGPGDNVGMNIKGIAKNYKPRNGDIMILESDDSLKPCKRFTAQVQVLQHPGELQVGYTPIAFVRTGRSAVKLAEINWKINPKNPKHKEENPKFIKSGEMAQVVFEPQQAFAVDSFKNCEGLGRVAIMEGGGVIMLGKVINVEF